MSDATVNKVTRDRLVSDFKTVLGDVEALLRETGGQMGEHAGELRGKLEVGVTKVKSQLHDLEGTLLDRSREAARATDDFVHDHPWESIGIGFGLGLLLGVLINKD